MAVEMTDIYWAAGFLEGEGSFTGSYQKRHATGIVRRSATFSVNAGQTNTEPLERLQRLFGGHIYRHNMHTGNPIWRWQLCGKAGIGLMMTLWTLMSLRRKQQIEICIQRFRDNNSRSEAQRARWLREKVMP
jgi:hypothetical protein